MQIRSLVCLLTVLFLVLALVFSSTSVILATTVPDLKWEETFDGFRGENIKLAEERSTKSLVCSYLLLAGGIFSFGAGICGVMINLLHNYRAKRIEQTIKDLLRAGRRESFGSHIPDAPDASDVPDVSDE